jgi:hypothetical protein
MAMDRQEATRVLHEILGECDGSLLMSCVSLSPVTTTSAESSSFELKISCGLDDYIRECINNVIQRRKLAMKELGTSVTIFSPRT